MNKPKKQHLIRKFVFTILLAAASVFCSGCLATAAIVFHHKLKQADMLESWSEKDGSLIKDIVYDPGKNLTYDLYLPKDIRENETRHAMIFIHGGAWNSGRKEEMAYACRRYVKEGYLTVTLKYSLAAKNGPPVTFFTMLNDISRCLAHLKTYTAEKKITIGKIALSGYSAGGHLAMLYAFTHREKSPLPIAFVFSQVGPTVFTREVWGADKEDFAIALASAGSGKKITAADYDSARSQEIIKSISPALLVNKNTVPGIYAYGGKDTLVRIIHAQKLEAALKNHQIPHEILIYPGSGHFLCEDPQYTRRYRALIREYCKKYF